LPIAKRIIEQVYPDNEWRDNCFLSFYIFYQPHVHGHERRTKDKQQNRHVYHVGSVQRRLEDTRRILEPSPVKLNSAKRQHQHCNHKTTAAVLLHDSEPL